MAGNIAKSFANMTLIYWEPKYSGSGVEYESPVEFKGKYIGDTSLGGGLDDFMFSGGGLSGNLVLFYMKRPKVGGFVSWTMTLKDIEDRMLETVDPSDIPECHKIDHVNEYPMIDAKKGDLKNLAFIAQVQ